MESYLIKGILIGLLFGMPIGAVGAMTVQRTYSYGFKAGLMTGLGSSVADCFYACVGAFGLTVVSDFLMHYQIVINTFGGILIFIMGFKLIVGKHNEVPTLENQVSDRIEMFLSSFAVGITNPAAIVTFLFAFSYFGITEQTGWSNGILLVAGVFIGTYIWWGALSAFVNHIKNKKEAINLYYMNKVFGTILILFGALVFVKNIL